MVNFDEVLKKTNFQEAVKHSNSIDDLKDKIKEITKEIINWQMMESD